MTKNLRMVLAQLNLISGDIQGNLAKHIDAANQARDSMKANVIVFPELSLTGYLHEDLVFRQSFLDEAKAALNTLIAKIHGIYCVIGHPLQTKKGLMNACSVFYNGKILGQYSKQHLPNYGVFDECRYYMPGNETCIVPIEGVPVGIIICEDVWYDQPVQSAAKKGARMMIVLNASTFEIKKHEMRQSILAKQTTAAKVPIIYVNHNGGQDDLVFDGDSMVVDETGHICQHAGFFKEILFPVDFEIGDQKIEVVRSSISVPSEEERVYEALKLGVHDYVRKNHFKGALVGVSGGIDSALALAIAVDALGKENVTAVSMPSCYTADMSNEDAKTLADQLGVKHKIVPIGPVYNSFLKILDRKNQITLVEENIQSRCRGVILMALSNESGDIVLNAGNRSEMAVGYATLYGDMAGGLNILKDIYKTWVYRLARYRNQLGDVIPERILNRPPTAELSPNQKDVDTLPPYEILDPILELYLDQELSIDDIAAKGLDKTVVMKVVQLIKKSEYKRRQAPLGIRAHHKAFGRDRRYPITQAFEK